MTVLRPSIREEQRRKTRRGILEAARGCFGKDGVADTSIEQIARAAGVGRATLYLHFNGKDALLIEMLKQNLGAVERIYQKLGAMTQLTEQSLTMWLEGYVDTLKAHRSDMQMVRVGLATTEAARRLIIDHHQKVAAMLMVAFPRVADDTPRALTRLYLFVARIDHCAGSVAEVPAAFDPAEGISLIVEEMLAMLRA